MRLTGIFRGVNPNQWRFSWESLSDTPVAVFALLKSKVIFSSDVYLLSKILSRILLLSGVQALLFFGLLFHTSVLAIAAAKKVTILDFKNFDRNPDYQYLEDSITDAVRGGLKERFAFRELDPENWRAIAKKNNFLWPEDNYTRSFGLALGVAAKQDVVIGGHYQALPRLKGNRITGYYVKAHVFVVDVGQRSVLSEFDITMPADASLFTEVENLAARVVREAQKILPNKGEVSEAELLFDAPGPNEIGLLGAMPVMATPAAFAGNFSTTQAIYPKDFDRALGASIFYRHRALGQTKFELDAGLQYMAGSRAFVVAQDTKRAATQMTDIATSAHVAYRFQLWRFSLVPLLGGGFSLSQVKLDYSTLTLAPLDSTGAPFTSDQVNTSAPFAEGGTRIELELSSHITLTSHAIWRQNFYLGTQVGLLLVGAGITFRL